MKNKLFDYLDLNSDMDSFDVIHRSIEKDIIFKGTNLWILMFAIVVASVGLNMNSTAVIIGAMLISPLMGPIIGIGYSIATYNFPLFQRALKNFAFAVIASLVASTLYFAISPVSTAYSELLARTSPTIYDVLIALFGGLAGIVAISSKNKGNVIPGVAIATALMPPLCTAGYGIATGQFNYFFGALYLFTINSVFIAWASLLISRILKFPILSTFEGKRKKRIDHWVSLVLFITVVPSIYLGWSLVQKEQFLTEASKFVQSVSIYEGNYLLNNDIDGDNKTITLVYGGKTLNDSEKEDIKERAVKDFKLDGLNLKFKQGFSVGETSDNTSEISNLKGEIIRLNKLLNAKNKLEQSPEDVNQLYEEIKMLFPEVVSYTYAMGYTKSDSLPSVSEKRPVMLLSIAENINDERKEMILSWLRKRLKNEELNVILEK